MLNHFVTRFLTNPWEFADRKLLVADFQLKEINPVSSKTLFALQDIYSEDMEKWLNRYIETPLADIRNKAGGYLNGNEFNSFKSIRAVALLILLQSVRDPANGHIQDLESWLYKSEDYINAFIDLYMKNHLMILMNGSHNLSFPDKGIFRLPSIGRFPVIGIPVNDGQALLVVDKQAQSSVFYENGLVQCKESLPTCSMGCGNKIILSPEAYNKVLKKNFPSDRDMIDHMIFMRDNRDALFKVVDRMTNIVASFGFY